MCCYEGRRLALLFCWVAGSLLTLPSARADWLSDDWSYRKPLLISAGLQGGGAAVSNLPVKISLAADAQLAAYARNDGRDIVFTAADGITPLPVDVEVFDADSGALVAWVGVATISPSSDTELFLYYGNATTQVVQSAQALWGNGYAFVHHFAQASGPFLDSTGNGLDAEPYNGLLQGVPGVHGFGAGMDGVDDVALISDTAVLHGITDFTLEAWMNTLGAGNTEGQITGAVAAPTTFSPGDGETPSVVQVSSNVYASAYSGDGNDGWLSTFRLDMNGQTGPSAIHTFEFDTTMAMQPDLIAVGGGIYAVAYKGHPKKGMLVTLRIDAAGVIQSPLLDTRVFDAMQCFSPDIFSVSGGVVGVAYEGEGSDGFLVTLGISSTDGTISGPLGSVEFDVNRGKESRVIQVAPGIFAIAYRGDSDIGLLKTYTISAAGVIGLQPIDALTFEADRCETPALAHVFGSTYAIAYRSGNDKLGRLATVEIAADGQIGNALLDGHDFEPDQIRTPAINRIGSGLFALAYTGMGSDGFLQTVRITADGDIFNSRIDVLEFDLVLGLNSTIIPLEDGVLALVYTGGDWKGMLSTYRYDPVRGALGSGGWNLSLSGDELLARVGDSLQAVRVTSPWVHVAMTYMLSGGGRQALYVDGVQVAEGPQPLVALPEDGNGFALGDGFAGSIDEARLLLSVPDAAWLAANYRAQSVTGAVFFLGPEEVVRTDLPVVDNAGGAVNVVSQDAVLMGRVTAGLPIPEAAFYFGSADGGTNAAVWQQVIPMGVQAGSFSNRVTGLTSGTLYYYRAFASNVAGTVWSPASTSFETVLDEDSDGDHLPDWWEAANGLNANDDSDALLDSDADGVLNIHEFIGNSNPADSNSAVGMVKSTPTNLSDVCLNLMLGAERTYEILVKSDPDGVDHPIGTVTTDAAGVYQWTDVSIGNALGWRFYRLRATHKGLSYTNEDVWAALAEERRPNTKYLLSVPLDYRTDNNLNGELGAHLARGLCAGSSTDNADVLQVLSGADAWKEFYLTTNAAGRALWWDEAAGAEADFAVQPGTGFWVVRKSGPATVGVNALLVGPCYKTPPAVLVTTSNGGWNVIGPPSHRAVRHRNTEAQAQYSTPSNQLGFASGGSGGTTRDIRRPQDCGDQIWVWENNEWQTYYWLMGHLGPQWDGKWWDIRKNDFANFELVPGRAYYYRHRTNRWGGAGFYWQPPTP